MPTRSATYFTTWTNKRMKANNDKKDNGIPEIKETITILKSEYEALKAKNDERDAFYDKYVRAHAEFENARKRIEKDKADSLKYANECFVLDFLPIIDSLEMSERHIKEAKDFKAVQDGVDMIQLQIQNFLKNIGLERMETLGERFDPHMHEPIETVEADNKDDGIIVAELKPGYKFNGKLLRPAAVKIVKNK